MTWPPRWDRPHFKGVPASTKKVRAKKAKTIKKREIGHKATVRLRDRTCRFPLCGCKRKGYALHVAHLQHKGIGGNPAGDRSQSDKMILLCAPRHREDKVSVDRGTVQIRPMTDAGTAGPCAFNVCVAGRLPWVEVARETALHRFEPFTPEQRAILNRLKGSM